MNQFDEFQADSKAEGKDSVNFNDFFDKMYDEWEKVKQERKDEIDTEVVDEQPEDSEPDEEVIEFFDTQGNKQKIKEDELFYIQSLVGKVDWESFAEKNQERIETINKVDKKIEEVKKVKEGEESKTKKTKKEETSAGTKTVKPKVDSKVEEKKKDDEKNEDIVLNVEELTQEEI